VPDYYTTSFMKVNTFKKIFYVFLLYVRENKCGQNPERS
jgi:hypothetical protein